MAFIKLTCNFVYFLAFCFLVISTVTSKDAPSAKYQPKTDGEKFIVRLLEYYRNIMKYGSQNDGIPIMDPYHPPKICKYETTADGSKINANFTNLEMIGLATVEIKDLNLDDKQLYIQLCFDSVTLTGDYEMDIHLSTMNFQHIYGHGTFNSWLSSIWISVYANFTTASDQLLISGSNIEMDIKDLGVNFKNLMGGGLRGVIMNNHINSVGKYMFSSVKKDMLNELADKLQTIINVDLQNNNLKNLEEFGKRIENNLPRYDKPTK